jgi:hypothetical protein
VNEVANELERVAEVCAGMCFTSTDDGIEHVAARLGISVRTVENHADSHFEGPVGTNGPWRVTSIGG